MKTNLYRNREAFYAPLPPACGDVDELLTIKELADAVKRHRSYISAMKGQGFAMPGGTASVREYRSFLARNLPPRRRK